mgnify:CR=1 FL=1
MASAAQSPADLFVIGGGVNGCGIARDAVGRGLSVTLAEKSDIGGATSAASTKLFHGGLRYLEYFEIRLVREALIEREVLLRAMPHISWPMRFVLPYHSGMRFETETPVSKLLSMVMPWMKGRRPAWVIRMGLFLYDHLGGRKVLPGTRTLDLTRDPAGAPLKPEFRKAFEYSDCWVEDSRLVVLNARDAEARGARILPRTEVISATREGDLWRVETRGPDGTIETHQARALINAGGPWAERVIRQVVRSNLSDHVRLVRGSHIVTRKLYDHDRCYFLQGSDGRIIFTIPYEEDFTLIGTTDAPHEDPDDRPECTAGERDYLLDFVSHYFREPVRADDIVWSYAGVRPLYDDGATSATAATRDYVLKLDDSGGAPLLNIFGGKITTYRRLAEAALARLQPHLPAMAASWTAGAPLPGGDFALADKPAMVEALQSKHPFLTGFWARRMIRDYGSEAGEILGEAGEIGDLGRDFGGTLTEAELRWLMEKEYAMTAEDVLWRRSKLGLRLSGDEAREVGRWMAGNGGATAPETAGERA